MMRPSNDRRTGGGGGGTKEKRGIGDGRESGKNLDRHQPLSVRKERWSREGKKSGRPSFPRDPARHPRSLASCAPNCFGCTCLSAAVVCSVYILDLLVFFHASQRVETLKGVESEKRRLEDLLEEGRASQSTLLNDLAAAREVRKRFAPSSPAQQPPKALPSRIYVKSIDSTWQKAVGFCLGAVGLPSEMRLITLGAFVYVCFKV